MPHQLYYNNKKKYLAIKHQSVNYDSAWDSLFMHFAQSVATIISEKYGQVVARLSTGGLDAISYNIDSLPATEEMTDMLFALGDYESATYHRFFDSQKLENWRTYIPNNSKDFILVSLFQDKKISFRYLSKHLPRLLYTLSSHTVFQNIPNISVEKIDSLPIPSRIKNDLKEKSNLELKR